MNPPSLTGSSGERPQDCTRSTSRPAWGQDLGQDTALAVDHRALTLVIFLPPEEPQLPKRFSEMVRTLEARWMVKRLLAGTFFLHLPRKAQAIQAVPTSTWQPALATQQWQSRWEWCCWHQALLQTPPHGRAFEHKAAEEQQAPSQALHLMVQHAAGTAALPHCGSPPTAPPRPRCPQQPTLTCCTCRRCPHPAAPASRTAPGPARCSGLAAGTGQGSGHLGPAHSTAPRPAQALGPGQSTQHGAAGCPRALSLPRHGGCSAPQHGQPAPRGHSSCSGTAP